MDADSDEAASLVGELELKALYKQDTRKKVDTENPVPLELLGINQVKPKKVDRREQLFSWLWPVSRRGITKEEVRRMEDFMMNTRDRPIRLASIQRCSELKRACCPPVLTQEELHDIQMQEFAANNNEAARQRVLATMRAPKTPPAPEAILPLWSVIAIPVVMVFLHLFLIYHFRPDLFHPVEVDVL